MEYRDELKAFLERPLSVTNVDFESIKPEILVTADELSSRSETNPGILLVYSDECGHCTRFKPEYVKLYKLAKKWNETQEKLESERTTTKDKKAIYKKFNVFAMDANDPKNSDFLINNNLRGVPTIYFITASGSLSSPYEKSRDANQIWKDLQNLKTVKKLYY